MRRASRAHPRRPQRRLAGHHRLPDLRAAGPAPGHLRVRAAAAVARPVRLHGEGAAAAERAARRAHRLRGRGVRVVPLAPPAAGAARRPRRARCAARRDPSHLFVYGTLRPGEVRWRHLAPFVVGDGIDTTVAGDVYDTGLDYPAAKFGGDGPHQRSGVRAHATSRTRWRTSTRWRARSAACTDGSRSRRRRAHTAGRTSAATTALMVRHLRAGDWLLASARPSRLRTG